MVLGLISKSVIRPAVAGRSSRRRTCVAVRTLWVALVTATLLAGCGGPGGEIGLRETGAGRTTMVSADPVPLAECMKDALERKEWGYIRATFPPTLSLLPH